MSYERALWSWTQHLRTGGSVPWRDWTASGTGRADSVPEEWSAPGAAQLEFVRRAAMRDVLDGDRFTALADLVTSRSGPGRGLGDRRLSWPERQAADPEAGEPEGRQPTGRRFGASPVDPSDVPAEELVRVGVGTLTELLLGSPDDPAGDPAERLRARRRPFTRTPAFVLAGAPVTVSAVRRALGVAGHVEGGRSPRPVLLAEPLDYALAQVWSARVQRGAPARWHGFVQRWSGRRDLPRSADAAALARRWADQVGAAAVHVVVPPGGFDSATRAVADVLGVDPHTPLRATRRERSSPLQPRWKDLTPAAVDVARRVNAVLGVRAPKERHPVALRRLVRILVPTSPVGHAMTVPEPFWQWARTRAERMTEQLSDGGYPVHGRLEGLVPRFADLPTHPRSEDALEAVVTACLRLAGDVRVNERGGGE